MSSPEDDRLLQRLGEALAVPAAEPSDREVERLRRAVGRLGARRPRTRSDSPTATRTCGDPEGLVALNDAIDALASSLRRRPREVSPRPPSAGGVVG